MDYDRFCFVVMPFGKKSIGRRRERLVPLSPWPTLSRDRVVDFDHIYESVFVPAVESVELEDGTKLEPRRTDHDYFSASISHDMFLYLEYSRIVLVDISGLNANVFYELGHRHRARPSGTPVFRQADAGIPFDISQVKAFPYDYEPTEAVEESRRLIARVLRDSLRELRPDSPIQLALAAQRQLGDEIHPHLQRADNAIRAQKPREAIQHYLAAERAIDPNLLLEMKIALLYRDQGELETAIKHLDRAIAADPGYAAAWRERGIAENRLHRRDPNFPDGEQSLSRAVQLDPYEFDALSSLGGIFKREGRYEEAMELYWRATQLSDGDPFPLLNYLTLRARADGRIPSDPETELRLERAARRRMSQATADPALDTPWSFFDLAQIRLFRGDRDGFEHWLRRGLGLARHWYEPATFADTLELLREGGHALPGLAEGIDLLRAHERRTSGAPGSDSPS